MKSSHGIILIVVSFIHYSYAAAGINCYKFMNVNMSDDKATLKSVYKKMAAKMHPDRNRGDPDATDNFQKLAWCHDMFQSKEKREQYHRCGEHCVNKGDANQNRFTSIRMETMTHRYASSLP